MLFLCVLVVRVCVCVCVCAAVFGRSFVVLVSPAVDIRLLNFFFYWRMADVEFYSKNKFEKLVHLLGFIIRDLYCYESRQQKSRTCAVTKVLTATTFTV